jgi:hypothetical protein
MVQPAPLDQQEPTEQRVLQELTVQRAQPDRKALPELALE